MKSVRQEFKKNTLVGPDLPGPPQMPSRSKVFGRKIFTVPICLAIPGYPPSDLDYFSNLPNNDQNLATHTAIACFLVAAHELT